MTQLWIVLSAPRGKRSVLLFQSLPQDGGLFGPLVLKVKSPDTAGVESEVSRIFGQSVRCLELSKNDWCCLFEGNKPELKHPIEGYQACSWVPAGEAPTLLKRREDVQALTLALKKM